MTTFVLVPGACHGGCWYAALVDLLTADGHAVVAVTLQGLDPAEPPPTRAITLRDHVAQLVAVVRALPDEGQDVVLVGHSYAGCLITAAADAGPDRVRALVYLDAFVPEDGDTCWTMTDDDQRDWYIPGSGRTGVSVDPLPFFDGRARPQPLGTLLQRSSLTGAWRDVPTKIYVAAGRWPGESPFASTTARLRADPAFTVHDWDTTHNVMADGPGRVHALLSELCPV